MNILVQTPSFESTIGTVIIGAHRFACTLGRTGVAIDKQEGDGKTPVGTYPLRQVIYRADRLKRPETQLPVETLTPDTGWCEDPFDPDYNTRVHLPHEGACDQMTRDDSLYDIVLVIGYNDAPVVPGRGSAIFMHLARPDFSPTAGCVGLKIEDLLQVLKLVEPDSHITILPPS